jgi:hypothetical protein
LKDVNVSGRTIKKMEAVSMKVRRVDVCAGWPFESCQCSITGPVVVIWVHVFWRLIKLHVYMLCSVFVL